jgi:hypothetical protein
MAALALAKWAFCLCKAALLFLAPANRRRVPPVQSMIPATWLAQSLLRQGVTFGVARGGVGEVGLSIKAASPDAPSSRTCFQRLLLNWLSATCLTTNSYCTAATNRNTFILLLPTPGSTTRRHNLRVNHPRLQTPSRPGITDAYALGSPYPSSDNPSWVWHVVGYASLPLADQAGFLVEYWYTSKSAYSASCN